MTTIKSSILSLSTATLFLAAGATSMAKDYTFKFEGKPAKISAPDKPVTCQTEEAKAAKTDWSLELKGQKLQGSLCCPSAETQAKMKGKGALPCQGPLAPVKPASGDFMANSVIAQFFRPGEDADAAQANFKKLAAMSAPMAPKVDNPTEGAWCKKGQALLILMGPLAGSSMASPKAFCAAH
jgi:hypothetical protein